MPPVANPLTARMHKGVNTTMDEGQTMIAHSLRGEGFDASEDGTGRGTPTVPIAFDCKTSDPARGVGGDISTTLRSMAHSGSHANAGGHAAVAVALRGRDGGATAELGDDLAHALRSSQGGGDKPHIMTGMAVRRLTPRECERLQGFPDGYTRIPWRNKPAEQCPDGPRYKALGNSWAVPCARWIGERIELLELMLREAA